MVSVACRYDWSVHLIYIDTSYGCITDIAICGGAYFSHDLPIHTVDGMIWSPDGESYASLSFQCLAFTDKSVLRLDVAICGGAYFSPDLPIRAVDGMIWSLDGECLDVVIVPPPPRLPKPLSE